MKIDLQQLISKTVLPLGFELWSCELFRHNHRSLLRVCIDSPTGITLDDCVRASRQISAVLDVEDSVAGPYDLEVSSPGVERPLFKLAHYARFVGHEIKFKRYHQTDHKRRYDKGIIKAIKGDQIRIQIGDTLLDLSISEIVKAHLVSNFEG